MGAFSMIPGMNSKGSNVGSFGGFDWSNFDFGAGGIFNGFNQSSTINQQFPQMQPSGGFNTIPGMPLGGSNSFGVPNFGSSFSANGTSSLDPFTLFGGGTSSIPGATSGFPGFPQVKGNALRDIYGHGVGDALQQFLNSGAGFNQGVIQAEMNAAMPLEARGLAQISNLMGNAGLASSSTAAIGYGDFESQFNAQLEQMFAQQYEQSVQNYLSVLTGVKQDAKENNAQQGNWMSMLSGILGGIGGAVGSIFGL